MAWGLEGRQLSYGWALALTYHVGFRDKNQNIAVALMTAESARYCGAWHENIDEGGSVDSVDHGLFQINDKWHPNFLEEDWFSAIDNAEYAFKMSQGKYFSAWAAYNSGAHLKFIPAVWAVKVLGKWQRKVPRVEEELGPRHQPTMPTPRQKVPNSFDLRGASRREGNGASQ